MGVRMEDVSRQYHFQVKGTTMRSWTSLAHAAVVAFAFLVPLRAVAQEPRLTDSQVQALKTIRRNSEMKAVPHALRLAETAKKIYENMLSDKEDQRLRRRLERELDRIGASLIAIKGQSIRDMVGVLSADQKALLKTEMRKPGAPADLSELIVKLFKVDGG
jgi:hypothetical protein